MSPSSKGEIGEGGFGLGFEGPVTVDRIVLMEDQSRGQVIREYEVYGRVVGRDGFTRLSNGTSIGHKKIDIFDKPVSVAEIRVNTSFVDTPRWRDVSVHLCD